MDIIIKFKDIILETPRLILREFNNNDLDDFFEYAKVKGVGEMAGWRHHKSKDESKTILNSFIESQNVFAIVYKENNKVIGSLGIHYSDLNNYNEYKDLNIKEIGYVLAKSYWGKGLMPEAVKELVHYLFTNENIDALTVGHFDENNQSRKVIEKCGFKYVMNIPYYAKQLNKSFKSKEYILYNECK